MAEAVKKDGQPSSTLLPSENYWVEKYEFLKAKGYQLRPRYQPGANLDLEENSLALTDRSVMDAVRAEDGRKVCLKRMSAAETMVTRELVINREDEPGNHTVPLLNLISTGKDGERIAVMPYLREFDNPPFDTLGAALDAVGQFLEGLEFIHKNHVAHRDACWGNMMVDASQLIPGGWHFVRPWTEDGVKPITSVPRSSVSVKYYFIDFGLSVFVKPSDPNPTVTGIVGQDRTVPEHKDPEAKYNPFKLDIYQLGNAIRTRLVENYEGIDILIPLVTAMTSENPEDRPTATAALEMLKASVKDADRDALLKLKPGVKLPGVPQNSAQDSEPAPSRLRASVKARILGLYQRVVGRLKRLFRP